MKRILYLLVFNVLMLQACKDPAELSNSKDILSFEVEGQVDPAIIISDPASICVIVDTASSLTNITPQITVSDGASVKPESGETVDFSSGIVTYKVTAQNATSKDWQVSVAYRKSDAAEVISFEFPRLQEGETMIEDTLITAFLKQGVDLTALKPSIVVSPNASINPLPGVETDFSLGPVIYTVTAESGVTKQWVVDAQHVIVYEHEILSYTVPDQDGESLFEGSKITIEVPSSTDFSNVTPTIVTTEGTTIVPASGEAVDFTEKGYVDYKVYSIDSTYKPWRVYLIEEIIDANNPYIQYMGRVDYSNPLKPRLHSSGASIITKFQGTYCQIIVEDQNRWGSDENWIRIIVDDNEPIRMQTGKGINTIDVISGLSDGEHSLMIVKETEADIGYIDFIGFRADALLEPDPLPARKIEFIGNSITCGQGIDISQVVDCDAGKWYDKHSAYMAYGPLVARSFGAQWMLSSVSGIGLIQSCCDKTYDMPDVYEAVDFTTTGNDWDFSLYQPDIVSICLGQNDGVQDSAVFVSAYIDFIKTIRSYNPDADIICLTSPMADDNLFEAQTKYLTGVVDYFNSEGDTRIHKLYVSKGLVNGCAYHPSGSEHQIVANELITYITNNITW